MISSKKNSMILYRCVSYLYYLTYIYNIYIFIHIRGTELRSDGGYDAGSNMCTFRASIWNLRRWLSG
jgi:hypothetical protein